MLRSVRALVLVAVAVTSMAALPACGRGGGKKTTTTTAAPATTTTLGATLTVTPPSGPLGTTFIFNVEGFKAGESVTFEVDKPDGKKFAPGTAHPVSANGTVSPPAQYKATKPDPAGQYTVVAVGNQGSQAQGTFEVGAAGASTGASTGVTAGAGAGASAGTGTRAGFTTTTLSRTTQTTTRQATTATTVAP